MDSRFGESRHSFVDDTPAALALVGSGRIKGEIVVPTSLSPLLAAYPPEGRSYAVGVWASIGAAAAALGPPVGGLLVQLSWRWVFLVNVPVGVIAFVLGLRVLSDADRAPVGMPDLRFSPSSSPLRSGVHVPVL